MRKLLFTAACAVAVATSAQDTTAVAYERVEVVTLDSTKTAQQLYTTAKRWFVDAFKDAKAVIEMDDAATHTIVGNSHFSVPHSSLPISYTIHYSIEVTSKDGRYRVRMYNYVNGKSPMTTGEVCYGHHTLSGNAPAKEIPKRRKDLVVECAVLMPKIQQYENALLATLKAAMLKPAGPSDW